MPTFAHGMWFSSEEEWRLRAELPDLLGPMSIGWHQFTAVREGNTLVVEVPREWVERAALRLNAATDKRGAFEVVMGVGRVRVVPSDTLSTEARESV